MSIETREGKQPRKMNHTLNVINPGHTGSARIPGYYESHALAAQRMRKINDGFRALGKFPRAHAFLFPIPAIEEEGE